MNKWTTKREMWVNEWVSEFVITTCMQISTFYFFSLSVILLQSNSQCCEYACQLAFIAALQCHRGLPAQSYLDTKSFPITTSSSSSFSLFNSSSSTSPSPPPPTSISPPLPPPPPFPLYPPPPPFPPCPPCPPPFLLLRRLFFIV